MAVREPLDGWRSYRDGAELNVAGGACAGRLAMSSPKPETHDCRKCIHFWMGSDPSYSNDWVGETHECTAIPHMANLKSFPFKNTKCAKFNRYAVLHPFRTNP